MLHDWMSDEVHKRENGKKNNERKLENLEECKSIEDEITKEANNDQKRKNEGEKGEQRVQRGADRRTNKQNQKEE